MRSRRIQRHYHPLTLRSRFSPERLYTPPPSTVRTLFGAEDICCVNPFHSTLMASDPAIGNRAESRIQKPSGEVTRLSQEGYNLRNVLGWECDLYDEVQSTLHRLAAEHLNLDSTFTKQNAKNVETVFTLMRARHVYT
ncbi:hypothetical protein A0H81_14171 [Grifola frondosa]|uniref:Uncharacterized protein n=1 Tax=Grifola frondosa TaxID=5627 RepID=A0A1C7LPK0_GRIFR|nr:hypothetical protein A0H81_14171 [Grifola frondosa]